MSIFLEGIPDGRTLYHYTTIQNLKNIISSNELWLTNYSSLKNRDSQEVTLGFRLLEDALKRKVKDSFTLKAVKNLLPKEFYLMCFCKRSDNEHLWQEYANRSRGVVIAFDMSLLYDELAVKSDHIVLSPVDYSVCNYVRKIWQETKDYVPPAFFVLANPPKDKNDHHYLNLVPGYKNTDVIKSAWRAYCLKRPQFFAEEEIRLMHSPEGLNSPSPSTCYFPDKQGRERFKLKIKNLEYGILSIIVRNKDVENECKRMLKNKPSLLSKLVLQP